MKSIFLTGLLMLPVLASAGPTKVGNGDDGADLEKLQKIESGILVSTRDKALTLLNGVNVKGVKGLGTVEQELKHADIYIVQSDVATPKDFDAGMETSADGKSVYARTLAQPYAPVRFFPAAMALSEEQLVRLHIHEALHRSLPESIREDESAVSAITLAITSPTASRDSVELVTAKYYQDKPLVYAQANAQVQTSTYKLTYEPTERLKSPSTLSYSYWVFDQPSNRDNEDFKLSSMHRVDSFLYPFGGPTDSLGLGLSFSYLSTESDSFMGPLQVSGRQLLSTWRGFDVEAFATYSMYTLSSKEIKDMPEARDTGTLGISIRKEGVNFYTENFVSVILPNKKEFNVGSAAYTSEYSAVVTAKVGAGAKYKNLSAGLNVELSLADGVKVTNDSSSFESEPERMRMFKAGPEFSYSSGNFQASIYGKAVIDGTPGYNLSDIGDVLGQGAGQAYAGTTFAYKF